MYKDKSVGELTDMQDKAIQRLSYLNSLLKKQTKA